MERAESWVRREEKNLEVSVSLAVRRVAICRFFRCFWGSNLDLILFCDVSQNN